MKNLIASSRTGWQGRLFCPAIVRHSLWTAALVGVMGNCTAQTVGVQPTSAAGTTSTRPASSGTLPTAAGVTSNIARAEAANDANALVLAYGEATRDPQLARGALTQLLHDYFRLRALAVSAPQASQAVDEAALRFAIFQAAQNQVNVQQNQRLLEQNQRIIEQNQKLIEQNERMINLLDQIARKR